MAGSHPRSSGVAGPNLQKLTARQREELADWIRGWRLDRVEVEAFVDAVANAVWLYPILKQLGDRTSAGAIRRNLDSAIADGQRFLGTLNDLDGNSLQYLSAHAGGRDMRKEAAAILRALMEVRRRVEKFPKRGSRPKPERIQFASLLLRALRRHTSAEPSSVPAGIFDALLCHAFGLAGERYDDLHNLAARTLAAKLEIEDDSAVLSIDSPE